MISVGLAAAALATWVGGTRRLGGYTAGLLFAWLGLVWSARDPVSEVGVILAAGWQPIVLLTVWRVVGTRRSRVAEVAALLLAASGLVRVLVYEPFADPACRAACFRRDLTVRVDLAAADRSVLVGAAIATISGSAIMVIAGAQTLRSRRWPPSRLIAAVSVCAVLVVSSLVTVLTRPVPMPERSSELLQTLLQLQGVSVALLLGVIAVERLTLSRRVRRMADVVARGRQSAHDQLMAAVGDPTATITIVTNDAGHGADTTSLGPAMPGRRRTELAVRDRQVALIDHSDAIVPGDLVRRLGPQFAIAVQNDLLAVHLREQLAELQASRARVIAAADSERELLERDLHDGAQQRVLALSFELRRGHRLAERAGDVVAAERWSAATALTLALLQRLRHVASGIYPAVLDRGGLGVALESLAATGPPFREIEIDVPDLLAPEVRRAAYAIVRDAAPAPPGRTTVSAVGGALLIRFEGARRPQPSVIDRVMAAGGTHRGDGDPWEVYLPCA
ncbi:MAG: histidine kinase [Ilumatobacteraceae bacterium]